MIKYSEEFYSKSFTAKSMKEAYMKAVKWYSTNVLSKVEFKNVHVQFIKEDEDKFPTITIHLFAVLDNQEDVKEEHCKICKEMHHSFFINEDTHCSRCSALGFQNRMERKINNQKNFIVKHIQLKV